MNGSGSWHRLRARGGGIRGTTLGVYEYVNERCRRFVFRVFAQQPWAKQQRTRAQVGLRSSRKIRTLILIIPQLNYCRLSFSQWFWPNLFYHKLQWNMTKGGITGDVLEARTELCSLIWRHFTNLFGADRDDPLKVLHFVSLQERPILSFRFYKPYTYFRNSKRFVQAEIYRKVRISHSTGIIFVCNKSLPAILFCWILLSRHPDFVCSSIRHILTLISL